VLTEGLGELPLHVQPVLEHHLLVGALHGGLEQRHVALVAEAPQRLLQIVTVLHGQEVGHGPGVRMPGVQVGVHLLIQLQQ